MNTRRGSALRVLQADAIASQLRRRESKKGTVRKRMASKTKGTVGIVGLGIMGGAFAQSLVGEGWRVVGYDTDPSRRRAMARLGVETAADAADVARKVRTIITSLPSPSALASTVQTIVKARVPRRVIVEMSTFTLVDKAKAEAALHKSSHVLLDCPVSGTGAQAKAKDLVVYASGGAAEIKRLRPMFAAFTRAVHDIGAFGNGSRMKYVANLLVAINNVASAEAMVLGMKAGLPPQLIFDLIKTGAGNSRVFELRAPMMVKNDYHDVTMKISVWQKDMDVIGSYAKHIRVPTPMFDASKAIYNKALKSGHAAEDTAAVCAVLEAMAGLKRGRKKGTRRKSRP
jgi:L-threonate 2-dehydrogenase